MDHPSKRRIESNRDLPVWQKAMDLVVLSYQLTRKLPNSERIGLVAQIQRAASSIPANIAEGLGRRTRGDFVRHLLMANGSVKELETHLQVAVRLSQLTAADIQSALATYDEIGRMITGLVRKLPVKKQ